MDKGAVANLANFEINLSAWQGTTEPLYASRVYPKAGVKTMNFFVTVGRTIIESNMQVAGQMPLGSMFLIQSIEVDIAIDSMNKREVARSLARLYGWGGLRLMIGSANYLTLAPLRLFSPPPVVSEKKPTEVFTGFRSGPLVLSLHDLLLISQKDFCVILDWPEAPPITADATVFVYLHGRYYRKTR